MEDYGKTTLKNSSLRHIPIKASGIYLITNILDGKIYIGSANNIRRRLRNHLFHLRINKHTNQHLQRAFNRDGELSFTFDVLALCDKESLIKKEQEFLDLHKPYNDKVGYNICPIAKLPPRVIITDEMRAARSERMRGIPKSIEHRRKIGDAQKDRTYTKEQRKRISETLRKYWADPANREAQSKRQTGIKRNVPPYSEARRKAISDGRKGKKFPHLRKYKPDLIREWIRLKNKGYSYPQISIKYNIHPGVIAYVIRRYLKEKNGNTSNHTHQC